MIIFTTTLVLYKLFDLEIVSQGHSGLFICEIKKSPTTCTLKSGAYVYLTNPLKTFQYAIVFYVTVTFTLGTRSKECLALQYIGFGPDKIDV